MRERGKGEFFLLQRGKEKKRKKEDLRRGGVDLPLKAMKHPGSKVGRWITLFIEGWKYGKSPQGDRS